MRVPRPAALTAEESRALPRALRAWDEVARAEMPGSAPTLEPAPAAWAAVMLYRACQCLVYRDVSAEEVVAALGSPCPADSSASACYSVDLTMRYLPDLIALSRGVAEADPLVTGLLRLAQAWPLASVGVRGVGPVEIGAFIDHGCLRRVYADRILATADLDRLNDPRAVAAVREALGGHLSLAPDRLRSALARPVVEAAPLEASRHE